MEAEHEACGGRQGGHRVPGPGLPCHREAARAQQDSRDRAGGGAGTGSRGERGGEGVPQPPSPLPTEAEAPPVCKEHHVAPRDPGETAAGRLEVSARGGRGHWEVPPGADGQAAAPGDRGRGEGREEPAAAGPVGASPAVPQPRHVLPLPACSPAKPALTDLTPLPRPLPWGPAAPSGLSPPAVAWGSPPEHRR